VKPLTFLVPLAALAFATPAQSFTSKHPVVQRAYERCLNDVFTNSWVQQWRQVPVVSIEVT
jgi:hypothetical protein